MASGRERKNETGDSAVPKARKNEKDRPSIPRVPWSMDLHPTDQESFETWGEFLNEKGESLDGWMWKNGGAGEDSERTMLNLPWLTFVIGSGCRSDKYIDDVVFMPDAILKSSAWGVTSPIMTADGLTHAELARDFARSLIADRLDIDRDEVVWTSFSGDHTPEIEQIVQTVYAAALLSSLFRQIMALEVAPLARSERETATMHIGDIQWAALSSSYVAPARSVLDDLLARTNGLGGYDATERALKKLAKEMKGRLGERTVDVDSYELRAISEIAWLQIRRAAGRTAYPGWGDLLQALNIIEGDRYEWKTDRPFGKELDAIARAIELEYRDAARRRIGERGSADDSVYASVASILSAQSDVLKRTASNQAARMPLATAFTTTFDLELETALWNVGKPYVVALPVFIENKTLGADREVYPVWLGKRVNPEQAQDSDRAVNAITGCRPGTRGAHSRTLGNGTDDWFVLSNRRLGFGTTRFESVPIVVHLNGSPLMVLPKVGRHGSIYKDLVRLHRKLTDWEEYYKAREWIEVRGNKIDREELKLIPHHGVVLTEQDAIRQNAVELFSSSVDRGYELPSAVAGDSKSTRRFWLMLGVQHSDTAVSHRWVTQVMAPMMRESTELDRHDFDADWRRGVTVNQRIRVADQHLLFWSRMEVVTDEKADTCVPDIKEHLETLRRLNVDVGSSDRTGHMQAKVAE